MTFKLGQQVIYPNHGVATIEKIEQKQIGLIALAIYELRLSFNNSTVLVPIANADEVGIRLPISVSQCEQLYNLLSDNFSEIPVDWKTRFRDYSERLKKGEIFEVADVLKKLTYLSRLKPLSFREQRLLEKARYLVISELAAVCCQPDCQVEERIAQALDLACDKHQGRIQTKAARSAAIH